MAVLSGQFWRGALCVCALLLHCNGALAQNISLHIRGIDGEPAANVRAHLGFESLSCTMSQARLRAHLRGSDALISRALRAYGYYNASWTLRRSSDSDCPAFNLNITPGVPVTVSKLDIRISGEATDSTDFRALLASLPLKVGDRLRHDHYDSIKKSLFQLGNSQGYFESRFVQHTLLVDPEHNDAQVRIHWHSGERYRFGPIYYADSPLDRGLLVRFQPFAQSDVYDHRKVLELQSNLISSGYFDHVIVEQMPYNRTGKTLPIKVTTTAKSRYQTTVGAGVSTDTGPRLGYTLQNRRVNAAGDRLQLSTQLSPVTSNIGFEYTQPGNKPLEEKIRLSTGLETEDTDAADYTALNLEIAKLQSFESGWLQTTSLRFLRESYEVSKQSDDTALLIPGIAWSRSQSNSPRYPTRGWRFNSQLRGTLKDVVSEVSLFQLEIDGKLILPLAGGRLIARGSLGATVLDDFDAVPTSLRFFAGGDNSIRGYAYKSLGPEDTEGNVIGGKHRLTGSLEYDHKIWREFALASFIDAGNAFDSTDFTAYQSAGIGVRWFSPIGPIRLDIAVPLNNDDIRIHVSMGPDL